MDQLAEVIRGGGPIILVLAAFSVFSLALIVWKIIDLSGVNGGASRRQAALDDWQQGRRDEALAALGQGKSPADRMLAAAMKAVQRGIGGALLEADLTRRGNEEMARMNQGLRLLELIAMVAPLLGLLGTVTGMIRSFQMLAAAEGSANASVLAGGIWEALTTTAAGLVVAIPAAIGAGLLSARVDRAAVTMESAVGELMLIEGAPPGTA